MEEGTGVEVRRLNSGGKKMEKDSLGLCELNGCFTLGAALTLCLTGSVNSPSL